MIIEVFPFSICFCSPNYSTSMKVASFASYTSMCSCLSVLCIDLLAVPDMPGEVPSHLLHRFPQQYWAQGVPMTIEETDRTLSATDKVRVGWPLTEQDVHYLDWLRKQNEKWMKPVHCEACGICRPQRHDWAGMYFANPEKHWCRRCWEILHPPEDKEDGD